MGSIVTAHHIVNQLPALTRICKTSDKKLAEKIYHKAMTEIAARSRSTN